MRRVNGETLTFVLLAIACSSSTPSDISHENLRSGTVARVGKQEIASETVQRIASREGITVREACDRAVSDLVLASGFESNPGSLHRVAVIDRAAQSRTLMDLIARQVRDRGPPTDAEVVRHTAEHWTELDRPMSVKVTHVVVQPKTPEEDQVARTLAERLAVELTDVQAPDEFIKRARAFPAGTLKVVAEGLPAVTEDGRTYYPEGPAQGGKSEHLDPTFARAANAIEAPGRKSPVVKTSFGYHVILLEARYPPQQLPFEDRKARLELEIFARRAQEALQELTLQLKAHTPIDISRAADDLTSRVPVAP